MKNTQHVPQILRAMLPVFILAVLLIGCQPKHGNPPANTTAVPEFSAPPDPEPTASATPAPSSTPTTAADPRKDVFEVTDKKLLRYASADLLRVTISTRLITTKTGYAVNVLPWESLDAAGTQPICPDERFAKQPMNWNGLATSVLVGGDLVLSTRHTLHDQTDCKDSAFVFDYGVLTAGGPLSTTPRDGYAPVTSEQVYFCSEVVATGNGAINSETDWILVRLDREVAEKTRIPLKLRRNEQIEPGTEIAVIGHEFRLPMKVEVNKVTSVDSGTRYIRATAHVNPGSSGSMVVNRHGGRLEGIVATGGTYDIQDGKCWRENYAIPGLTGAVNVAHAAPSIPAIGLDVRGPADVSHYGPPGGPFTELATDYSLKAGKGLPTEFDVELPTGILRAKSISSAGPLEPGETRSTRVLVDDGANKLAEGRHEFSVNFIDKTYTTVDTSKHVFFVGVEGFDVQPNEDFVGPGPGASPKETKTYTVESRWGDAAQVVHVRASDPWILLNGKTDPVTLVLGGPVSKIQKVQVSFDPSLFKVDGVFTGKIEFTADTATTVKGGYTVTRKVRVDHGRRIFRAGGLPAKLNEPSQTFVIPVKDEFTIADADVGLSYRLRGVNGPKAARVTLTSPAGTRVLLIGDHSKFAPDEDEFNEDVIFDDDTYPPVEPLAALNGQSSFGKWTVTFESRRPGTPLSGELSALSLRLIKAPDIDPKQ